MRLLIVSIFFLAILQQGKSQDVDINPPTFMFWNVENAFDTHDDPDTEDNDFLPEGVMRWNESRYRKKINDIYKTIAAAGEWTPPDIVAFCEIENRKVLEDIIYNTNLSRYDYGIIHEDSPDERGIDVCLIYRKDRLKIAGYKYIYPKDLQLKDLETRTILYAGLVFENDTLHLFFNHWPSRKGGVLASEDLRMKMESLVSGKADSILQLKKGRAKIIIAGDFNTTPDVIKIQSSDTRYSFVNLTARFAKEGKGSYRYKGVWEMIDQVIVSDYLLNCSEGLYLDEKSAEIFSPFFLLTKEPDYPGLSPFSTYRGRRYRGGVSDHLPVLARFRVWPRMLPE